MRAQALHRFVRGCKAKEVTRCGSRTRGSGCVDAAHALDEAVRPGRFQTESMLLWGRWQGRLVDDVKKCWC